MHGRMELPRLKSHPPWKAEIALLISFYFNNLCISTKTLAQKL